MFQLNSRGFFIRASQKHAEHVQPHRDHHQVAAQRCMLRRIFAEGHIVLEIEHVAKGLHLAGMVIEHQQHAGEGEDDEQIERDSAHAPGVAVAHRVAIDLRRMQMQEDVGKHAQRPIARRVVVLVAEDRSVDLSLGRIFQALDLFLGFGWHVGLERLNIALHARAYALDEPDFPILASRAAVTAVRIVFVSHKIPL
jgi:hypothetical protein